MQTIQPFDPEAFDAAFPHLEDWEVEYNDEEEDAFALNGVCFHVKPGIEELLWLISENQTNILSLWEPPSSELLPLVFQFNRVVLLGTPKVGSFAVVHRLIGSTFPTKEFHFHFLLAACTKTHLEAIKAILPNLEGIWWHQIDVCDLSDSVSDSVGDSVCEECDGHLVTTTTSEAKAIFGEVARPW